MIALTAYGIRKAYKKQQARKAHKEQLERENQGLAAVGQSGGLTSISSSSSSSYQQSPDLYQHQVNGELVNNDLSRPPSVTRVQSASPSAYSASLYSQRSYKDPLEEMRQYRAYIQRQSYDFGADTNPPTYEFVVGQGIETTHPWKSGLSLPARTESPSQIQEARHIPQGPNRVVELDSSSESSPTERVPLRLFHPRSPVTDNNGYISPATELPADFPERVVSPILDDQLQASLDELVAEVPLPLRIGNSKEIERYELPVNQVNSAPAGYEKRHEEEHSTEPERQQLKRSRSESGSEIESEDNEEVIVRFNVADRTRRSLPKRVILAD